MRLFGLKGDKLVLALLAVAPLAAAVVFLGAAAAPIDYDPEGKIFPAFFEEANDALFEWVAKRSGPAIANVMITMRFWTTGLFVVSALATALARNRLETWAAANVEVGQTRKRPIFFLLMASLLFLFAFLYCMFLPNVGPTPERPIEHVVYAMYAGGLIASPPLLLAFLNLTLFSLSSPSKDDAA